MTSCVVVGLRWSHIGPWNVNLVMSDCRDPVLRATVGMLPEMVSLLSRDLLFFLVNL